MGLDLLWRRKGLKVPAKQPKRGRLWLNDGSCVRLRAERADHVWSYDFVHHRTRDGRAFRTLNVLDEFTRESLGIGVARKISSTDVIDVLTNMFLIRGVPAYIRSDNGPEFVAESVRRWVAAVGAQTAFIEPGASWENGFIESFNARLRDELLNSEVFYSLREARHCRGDPPVAASIPCDRASSPEDIFVHWMSSPRRTQSSLRPHRPRTRLGPRPAGWTRSFSRRTRPARESCKSDGRRDRPPQSLRPPTSPRLGPGLQHAPQPGLFELRPG